MNADSTWKKLRANKRHWKRYLLRETVYDAIRDFFKNKGYKEIETPLLVASLPPESYLDVFEVSTKDSVGQKYTKYLPTSPEPFLKKLITAGVGNCFTITKSFRNCEHHGPLHAPEFSLLEWYQVHADYTDIMKELEELFHYIYMVVHKNKSKKGNQIITYNKHKITLSNPWERITVSEAFNRYANIDEKILLNELQLKKEARKKGYQVTRSTSWEEVFHQILLNEIEPYLGKNKPTILYDYPIQLAALAKKKRDDKRFAERFELYIAGIEIADAYSELTDWREQKRRFKIEQEKRVRMKKVNHPTDNDFIRALKTGMPETGGIALGLDRLIMLLAGVKKIQDIMLFSSKE